MIEYIKRNKDNIIIFLVMFIFLLIPFISLFPGIFTIDGHNQWAQIESGVLYNNHPFFSTFIWYLLSKIWYSPASLCFFQIILISSIWVKICSYFDKNGLFIKVVYTIILCFLPIFFAYAITTWKDVIYSYNLVLLSLFIFDIVVLNRTCDSKKTFILSIILFFIYNYRYNGIVVVGAFLLMSLIYILVKKKYFKQFIFVIIYLFVFNVLLLIPKYFLMKDYTDEQYGVSAVDDITFYILADFALNDKLSTDDFEIINEIYPFEYIKEDYNSYVINPLKRGDNRIKAKYKSRLRNMLIKYSLKDPLMLIKHLSKSDNLLFGLSYQDGYVYVFEFDNWYSKYTGDFNIMSKSKFKKGYDFYLYLINDSSSSSLKRKFYLPAYPMILSILILGFFSFKRKNYKFFVLIIPMLLNTLSLSLINIAQDLRYVYINYLTLIVLVIPFVLFYKEKEIVKLNDIKKTKGIIINKKDNIISISDYNFKNNLTNSIEFNFVYEMTNSEKINYIFDYIIDNDYDFVLFDNNIQCKNYAKYVKNSSSTTIYYSSKNLFSKLFISLFSSRIFIYNRKHIAFIPKNDIKQILNKSNISFNLFDYIWMNNNNIKIVSKEV